MSDHEPFEPFTVEEADTEAGRIRGVILDTIALRVGQVPDVHPRLLEGIETAARILAAAAEPTISDEQRDERLVDIYLAGFVSGAVHLGAQVGVAPAAAYADSSHTAWHIKEDPIARAQLAEAVLVKWLTGEQPPPATITAYGLPSDPEETT